MRYQAHQIAGISSSLSVGIFILPVTFPISFILGNIAYMGILATLNQLLPNSTSRGPLSKMLGRYGLLPEIKSYLAFNLLLLLYIGATEEFLMPFDVLISLFILAIAGLFGGLWPDIDHSSSRMGRKLPVLSKLVHTFFGHRGMTHSPLFILCNLLFFLLLLLIVNSLGYPNVTKYVGLFAIGFITGSISHIILDSSTVSGTPVFYPFKKENKRFARLRTGKHDYLAAYGSLLVLLAAYFIHSLI